MKSSIFYKNKGFTLVELIVVMAISTVIMTTLVIQQSKWNDSLIVSTQAFEMALVIRQAQIYSLGVREDTAGSGDKFNIGYGVYFSQNHLNQYIYFADRDGDKKYDSSPNEAIETKTFNRGVTIKDVCGSSSQCFPGGGALAKVGILFFRPETKADIRFWNAGEGNDHIDTPPVTIRLQSPGGKYFCVKVESNGQVSTYSCTP